MSIHEAKTGAFSRLLSTILILSMLVSVLHLYINSASDDDNYDLPWLWPVPGSYVITGLDYYPGGNAHDLGNSLDIGNNGYAGSTRLDVVSATNGEVLYIQNTYNETSNRGSGWGNYVIVKSGNTCIVYAHLQSVSCKYGKINVGDTIGKMGNTGNSSEVHLHMQAYPINQKPTSTNIYVFDKYINNPLYVSGFRFRNGLISSSARYGAHLAAYYKTLSGTDHVFSGEHFGDYREINLGATLKSVRYNGARVYSQPSKSSSPVNTVAFGNEVAVYGYYTDAYGTVWYLVSPNSLDQWIPESEVGFSKYSFGANYKDEYSPSGTYGKFSNLHFEGKITVLNTIKSVRAEIRNESGIVASYETAVGSAEFDINNKFASGFGISSLSDGNYKYEIFVTEVADFPGVDSESKTYSVFTSDFAIDKLASDDVPPLVEEIKITSMTDESIKFSVNATDNKKIDKFTFNVTHEGGYNRNFAHVVSGNTFSVEIPISSLNGAGHYTITAKALDPFMNADESCLVFTVPIAKGSEVWKVNLAESSNLNLREGPGRSYAIAGSVPNGSNVTISQVDYNTSDRMYWANVGSGWCSLDYAVYQSGSLYSVTFNLLGGSGDVSMVPKPFNQNATIPNVTPTRTGYAFIGWASSPTATAAEYQPGSIYTKNESAKLFAVWQDKTAPMISGVTVSMTGTDADSVTISVNASDNSGTVYYSFDGGASYRRSNFNITYDKNTIPAKTIMVKDAAGNVAVYDAETVIPNVGTLPPGFDGFAPGNNLDARVEGDCYVVNAHSLTADALISYLANPNNIKIHDKFGTLMNGGSELVYSGCIISTYDADNIYRALTVIILGDADRNGKLTSDDVTAIMKLSNGMLTSSDQLDLIICDLDGDGKITSLDAAKIYGKVK